MNGKQLAKCSDAFRWDRPNGVPSVVRECDDGFDFPPTVRPSGELSTANLFVLAIITFVVWGGWKLISLTLTSLL